MLQTKQNKKLSFSVTIFLLTLFVFPQISTAQSISKPAVNPSQVSSALIGCLSLNSKVKKFVSNFTSKLDPTKVTVNDQDAKFREACLNKIGYLASRIAIQQITNRTIAWINTGFDGNPFWTTEDQNFYKKISNTEIKTILEPYTVTREGGQAFAKEIAKQIIVESKTTFEQKTTYTGPGKTFTTEFQKGGGWNSWFNLTSNPANDPLGFALLLTQQKEQVISQKISEKSRELQTNDGFLSQKKCVNPKNYKPLSDYERKQAQGESSVAIVNKDEFVRNYFNDANVSYDLIIDPVTKQLKKDPKYEETLRKANNAYQSILDQANQKSADAKTAYENSTCLEWKTLTPGKIISNQLNGVLGSPLRQSELADDINESLSAVFDALLNQLAQKGLNSLSQKSTYNYKSMYPTNDLGFSTDVESRDIADSADYWQSQGESNNPFKVRALIPVTIPVQNQFLDILNDTTDVVSKIPEDIGELDYCIPGPTPNWRTYVEDGINQITNFAFNDPSGDTPGKTATYNFIDANFNVTVLNDNDDDITNFEDDWLSGKTKDKVKKIKDTYDEYSALIESRYENKDNYVTRDMLTIWDMRGKVEDEMSRYDEYSQTVSDNKLQSQLTNTALQKVIELKPKYDALFVEVCSNSVNVNKLPCVCDTTIHPYIDLTKPDMADISVISPEQKNAYRVKYYQVCKNAGYVN